MAEPNKSGDFTTLYEDADAGTLGFARREDIEEEVLAYIEIVAQLKQDYADDPRHRDRRRRNQRDFSTR